MSAWSGLRLLAYLNPSRIDCVLDFTLGIVLSPQQFNPSYIHCVFARIMIAVIIVDKGPSINYRFSRGCP